MQKQSHPGAQNSADTTKIQCSIFWISLSNEIGQSTVFTRRGCRRSEVQHRRAQWQTSRSTSASARKKVESTQLVVQERISDRIVEQVNLVPQGREEIVEVVKNPVQDRFLGETRELIMHASVPQVDEQTFGVPEMQSRDRFSLVFTYVR